MEIIAHEMVLDLNSLIDAIVKSNELDEAKDYLTYTARELLENNEDRYYRLMLDLLGEERFNVGKYRHGIFIAYDPIQILYWIFNPMFEDLFKQDINVSSIRDALLSKEFWEYVSGQLKFQKEKVKNIESFTRVINRIIPMVKDEHADTFTVIKGINKELRRP